MMVSHTAQPKEDIDTDEICSRESDGSDTTLSEAKATTEAGSAGSIMEDDMNNIKEGLTHQETKLVFRQKVFVISILFFTATGFSYTIYHLLRKSVIEAFEEEFEDAALLVAVAVRDLVNRMSILASLAAAISAEAHDWPYVTLDDFHIRANSVQFHSRAAFLSVNPIVQTADLPAWESYVQSSANSWIAEGLAIQDIQGINDFVNHDHSEAFLTNNTVDPLHTFNEAGQPVASQSTGPRYVPRWQTFPVLETSMPNENLLENQALSDIIEACIEKRMAILGGFHFAPPGGVSDSYPSTSLFATISSIAEGKSVEYLGDAMTHIAIPIFESASSTHRGDVVGVLLATLHWTDYLRNVFPGDDYEVNLVIENKCDPEGENAFVYEVHGPDVEFVGREAVRRKGLYDYQQSDNRFDEHFNTDVIQDGTVEGLKFDHDFCPYVFHIFSAEADYDFSFGITLSSSMAAVITVVMGMFLWFDRLVERRQRIVLAKATQSTAIVSSLFPKQVRDRLLAVETEKNNRRKGHAMVTNNQKVKSFLSGPGEVDTNQNDQPIADLFLHCTVMFADIAGFTAWSSAREPAHVFVLLQTVYQNFDLIAHRRRVFKVETIGDAYMAVTGLPEPQAKHASIMARFAWDCLDRMGQLTKELESVLGPDTGALSMRFGLHSGDVIAGVLKGDRARFQLFGDTVNTAARMESTGLAGRIQVSSSTAEALRKEHKAAWLTPRHDDIAVKGKGVMSTYWLAVKKTEQNGSTGGSDQADENEALDRLRVLKNDASSISRKEARVVSWACEILVRQIKKVVIVHQRCPLPAQANRDVIFRCQEGKICLDEVEEAISTPDFNPEVADAALDFDQVQIPKDIYNAIQEYVTIIAAMYRPNKFHNFEHACHVTMSVAKLLSRVVSPELSNVQGELACDRQIRDQMAAQVHDFTHGLTSDPLATLALVFAGLVHDIDHQGVSNTQLAKEYPELADRYRNKSVAEQNSLDIAWEHLMSDRFKKMREYIFETQEELLRFRQLIVNTVLATDIFDKELNQLRKDRWQRAFHADLPDSVTKDLRATIVMEHIIQASDVAHTMQHWHLYRKWNVRLFDEMYTAFKEGRLSSDPSKFWYQGELDFFDNYVIPLATKLKECNVFGVSSDEYLAYAIKNRDEWAERGEAIVQEMLY